MLTMSALLADACGDEIFFHTPGRLADALAYTVLAGGRTRATPDQAPTRRQYRQHVLILTLQGEGWLQSGGRSVVAPTNTLAWLDTSAPYAHACRAGGAPWHYAWMGVQGYGLDALYDYTRARVSPVFSVRDMAGAVQVFDELVRALQCRGSSVDGVLSALVARALALMMAGRELPFGHESGGARLANLIARVAGQLARAWTIDDLAQLAGVSASQLHRQFRQRLGTSPMDWLRHERMNAAKRDLVASNEPVTAIAARCGYPDPYHFSRDFRRIAGQSPTGFRQSGGR